MVGKIVNVDQLGFDEASRIEGDWSRFSDNELAALSSSKSASSIRNELESGDIALIVDSPSSPMLSKMENGFSVSQQNAPLLSDYGVKKIGHRFSGNYYGGTVAKSGGSLHPAKPMPTYIPEPVIKTQPSIHDPIKISDNLSKPKTNKIFAKSCSQPFGNTEACQKKESINNAFRFWGMFINSAEAMAALPAASVVGSEIALGAGAAQNKSINGKTALALTKVVGNFKDKKLDNMRFSVEISPVMTTAVVLFKVLHFGDKTQYTEDELRDMKEVQSRIRVQITEPVGDNVYPTVRAYHVDDTRIPVRSVGKNEQGQYSVALEENGPKIYWSPDESGKQVSHTTPSQDDGESFSDFWINPLSDAVNDPSTAYPISEDSDWRDTVLVFPEGSGIEPLYIVYSILGGRHRHTKKDGKKNDTESHHLIADHISDIHKEDALAIKMKKEDHVFRTASWGNRPIAIEFRSKQEALVKAKKYDEALQMGIDDVRSRNPGLYDEHIKQCLESAPKNTDGTINWSQFKKK